MAPKAAQGLAPKRCLHKIYREAAGLNDFAQKNKQVSECCLKLIGCSSSLSVVLFLVSLWFEIGMSASKEAGVFIGIWVCSIHSAGNYFRQRGPGEVSDAAICTVGAFAFVDMKLKTPRTDKSLTVAPRFRPNWSNILFAVNKDAVVEFVRPTTSCSGS